ncbi:MAG: FAD-dependent oxidoreductase [Metamycoplasmataceae bacterium]
MKMGKKQKSKNELPAYEIVILGAGYTGFSLAKLLMKYNKSVLLIDIFNPGIKGSLEVKLFSFVANKWKGIETTKFLSMLHSEMKQARKEIHNSFNSETFKDTSVTFISGIPKIISENTIEINNEKFKFKKLVFATGSSYKVLNTPGITKSMYINPDQIASLDPSIETVAIYGTNWIALEIGQSLTKIGVKVYFVDKSINPFNDFDDEIEATLKKEFKNNLMSWCLESEVTNHNQITDKVIRISLKTNSIERYIDVNKIINTERVPNTSNIESPFELNKNMSGAFIIDSSFRMKEQQNFYAIGDVNGLHFYPNQGYYQACLLAENFAGNSSKFDVNNFSFSLNIEPSISFFGMNKGQIEHLQIPYNEFIYEFKNDYKINNETKFGSGRIKLFTNKKHELLGVILIGDEISELINIFSIIGQNNIKFHKLARLNIPFFTKGEFVRDAALQYYYEFILEAKKLKSKKTREN